MAVDYDIQNLELESAQSLHTMLVVMDHTYHHELSLVIHDVACLMTRFKSLVFKHIPRGNNKAAHCLAQYALGMALGHKMFLKSPTIHERGISGRH